MILNNDRFLTRVFDKKQKEMWYAESKYGQITNKGFYGVMGHVFNPFGERFVPMQCWGLPDKNKKLIYDDDIIKFQGYLYRAAFREFAFGFESLKEVHNVLVPTPLTRNNSEIIGNRWEQPELMEVKYES